MARKMSCGTFSRHSLRPLLSLSATRTANCLSREVTRRLHQTSCNLSVEENTRSTEEVAKFASLSSQWWDQSGEFVVLKAMNKLRISLIKDVLLEGNKQPMLKPLDSFKILDVGSGGGLLSEPLARLGAQVTGIDPIEENVLAATAHAKIDANVSRNATYLCSTVEELVDECRETFDAVVASEVIEHVNNQSLFVKHCSDLLKPGGHVFYTTINRTMMSLAFAKIAAEYILRIVPEGVHDWEKFVTTEEMTQMLRKSDMEVIKFHGMIYNPLLRQWYWCDNTDMNYACHARKPQASSI
eukprot:gene380-1013_t